MNIKFLFLGNKNKDKANPYSSRIMEKHNPWGSGNIDTYLFYCCPECENEVNGI